MTHLTLIKGGKPNWEPAWKFKVYKEVCPGCFSIVIEWREMYRVGDCPRGTPKRFRRCHICSEKEWRKRNVRDC